jgi:hypothetical protein
MVSGMSGWLRAGFDRLRRGSRLNPPADPFEPYLERRWPVGQYYGTLTASEKNNRRWVEYKLAAARWHLDALKELEVRSGELSRLIGEEMALDGVLGAGSSAFDAAVAGLILAIEAKRAAGVLVPPHQYSWARAKQLAAAAPTLTLPSESDVDAALDDRNTAAPTGWLAQFRQLRNRATHQDTLVRQFKRNVGDGSETLEPSQISVPGRGFEDPIPYLGSQLAEIRTLCEKILADADAMHP